MASGSTVQISRQLVPRQPFGAGPGACKEAALRTVRDALPRVACHGAPLIRAARTCGRRPGADSGEGRGRARRVRVAEGAVEAGVWNKRQRRPGGRMRLGATQAPCPANASSDGARPPAGYAMLHTHAEYIIAWPAGRGLQQWHTHTRAHARCSRRPLHCPSCACATWPSYPTSHGHWRKAGSRGDMAQSLPQHRPR